MFPSYHPRRHPPSNLWASCEDAPQLSPLPAATIQPVGALRQAMLDVLVARLRIVFGGLWEGEQAWRGPGLGLGLGLRVRVRVTVKGSG